MLDELPKSKKRGRPSKSAAALAHQVAKRMDVFTFAGAHADEAAQEDGEDAVEDGEDEQAAAGKAESSGGEEQQEEAEDADQDEALEEAD